MCDHSCIIESKYSMNMIVTYQPRRDNTLSHISTVVCQTLNYFTIYLDAVMHGCVNHIAIYVVHS